MPFVCKKTTAYTAWCAKGLWPQLRSLLVLALPHRQWWEAGLAMGQDGAGSIKSQVHPEFEVDVSLMAKCTSEAQLSKGCGVKRGQHMMFMSSHHLHLPAYPLFVRPSDPPTPVSLPQTGLSSIQSGYHTCNGHFFGRIQHLI